MLGGAVGADIGIALEPGGGSHRDHAAMPPLLHRRQHRLDGVDHAHEIDVHHLAEQRGIGFCERRRHRGAGVGHQDIDRLPRRGLCQRGLDRGLVGDVGHHGGLRQPGGHNFVQHRPVTAEHRHSGASARQRGGDGAADAATAAGNQGVGGA